MTRITWPMRADHITSDGVDLGLDGQGIITNRELQGYQSEISFEVGHATTIIEFSLNGQPIRTDSPFIDLAMHPTCRIFRINNPITNNGEFRLDRKTNRSISGELCHISDKCHAKLFYGLTEDTMTSDVIKIRKEQPEINTIYSNASNVYFKPQYFEKRLYLEYDCPLLGFRELIFPVIFEKRVIAVFFIGQLTLQDNKDKIIEQIGNVESRFPNCFRCSENKNDVVEKMKIAQEKWINGQSDFEQQRLSSIITKEQYINIIKTAFHGINNLEIRLKYAFEHKQHEYIRQSIINAPQLKELVKSSSITKENNLVDLLDNRPLFELWNNFEKILEHLVKDFELSYSLAFGPSRIINLDQDVIKVQAKAGDWLKVFDSEFLLKNMQIAVADLSKNDGYLVCSPLEENSQYLNLIRGIDVSLFGDFQLILLSIPQNPSSSVVVVLGYPSKQGFKLSNLREHAPNEYFHQIIKAFLTPTILAIAATRAKGLEELTKKQLLYLGHEAGQLTGGLDWLTKNYEDSKGFEEKLAKQYRNNKYLIIKGLRKKIEDLCFDIRGYTDQMFFVFNTAERLGSHNGPRVEYSWFLPYGDVLSKWKDLYRQECDRKCLQMRVGSPNYVLGRKTNDPWRPPMWGDRFLFEQMVYNIVNNAEKYCYRGTKIDIDCILDSLYDNANYILTVVDYGLPIDPNDESLYAPFKRGDGSNETPGLGLGLYIVKNIVNNVFKGEVKVLCDDKPISRFNIPLIKPYIYNSFSGKDEALVPQLKLELTRLFDENLLDSIVAYETQTLSTGQSINKNYRYIPSEDALSKEILKPTYKVTIIAKLPSLKKVEDRK